MEEASVDLLDLLKQTGGPGIAILVMAYMVKYFMGKLDERDKQQKEVIEKVIVALDRNTQAHERVLAVLEREQREGVRGHVNEVSQPGARVA